MANLALCGFLGMAAGCNFCQNTCLTYGQNVRSTSCHWRHLKNHCREDKPCFSTEGLHWTLIAFGKGQGWTWVRPRIALPESTLDLWLKMPKRRAVLTLCVSIDQAWVKSDQDCALACACQSACLVDSSKYTTLSIGGWSVEELEPGSATTSRCRETQLCIERPL